MKSALAIFLCCFSLTAQAENVLRHRLTQSSGAPQLTDGQSAPDGADWLVPGTIRIGPNESLIWDLGAPTELNSAAIQADNNDDYLLEVSDDGTAWRPWWRATGVNGAGLRTRADGAPTTTARFIRLSASGGDERFSVSEVEVFSGSDSDSVLTHSRWIPRDPFNARWFFLVIGLGALLFTTSSVTSRRLLAILGIGALFWTSRVLSDTFFSDTFQVDAARMNFLRGAVAFLGAIALVREFFFRDKFPAHRMVVLSVLGFSGVMGVLCFLNLGRAQFVDVGQNRPTFLHFYDMRTYYPIAKYFPELRFDGVYAASTMVVAEDRGGLDAMAQINFRDLRTHQGTTVGQARDHIEAVRARFSPERWASFVQDMRYFRNGMGDGSFLGSMNDHGGNATPVWFLVARILFAQSQASDFTLWLGVLLDAILVLLAFASLWNGFGVRTALVGMAVFGAMDFYQFGSNWFGAALRHDWLALWCLSLWALRTKRFRIAGGLLAWSALIRAFPALGFVTLSFPVLWDLVRTMRAGTFNWRIWHRTQRWFLELALGAAVTGGVLLLLSVLVFGADSWPEWFRKVSLLDRDAHLNNVAVRTWIATGADQWRIIVGICVAALFVMLRGARPETAVAWGVALVPIVFNPANYYLHAFFMLTVLAQEERNAVSPVGRASWVALLLMCTASAFTYGSADLGQHFRQDTYVAIGTLVVLGALALVRGKFERQPGRVTDP